VGSQTEFRRTHERPQGVSLVRRIGPPSKAVSEIYLDALARFAADKPDQIFLDHEGRTLTFAELDRRSNGIAHGLAGMGVRKGDRVITLIDNSDDLVLIFFAINKIGAIWVPINTAYRGPFLRHQAFDADAALAICESHYVEQLLDVAAELPALTDVFVRGACAERAGKPGVASFERLRAEADGPVGVEVGPDDLSALVYTSGTTGASKGCMVSHSYLASLGRQRNRCIPPEPDDITWSCLPLSHIAALGTVLISNLLIGGRIAIATHFSVSGFWPEIERSGATHGSLMASMFPLLAQAPDNEAMRRCRGQLKSVTGIPLSEADRRIWNERFGVEYMMTFAYGQTEANMVTMRPWGSPQPPVGSMGPPTEEFEVMVADDAGQPVPIGETGELCVRPTRPGGMFSGYWRRPEDTLKAMRDLWWHTGDFVRMDEEGYLFFVDRKKDYLRSRGENISSFEVESALMTHPAISEAACFAIAAGQGLEEHVKAAIVLAEGAAVAERALFEWARDNLPYFAVPRYIELLPGLPKTPTGRVQKHELRAKGVTVTTWDSVAEKLEIRRPKRR
jgi:crotonobetaine/carnitine-CoA ligase